MRIPVKSERDAFFVTYGVIAILVAAIVLGALITPLVGVALVVGVVVGALIWELASKDPERPKPLREAAAAARAAVDDGRRRILVVANETIGGQELREELRDTGGAEIRVVCPILPSRAHLIASDIDRELAEARARLDHTLGWAREQGLEMEGKVSEETPLTAVCDELRVYPADEVIVSTHPVSRSKWLETGLVERLREELDIPVRHVVVDLTRQEITA